MPIKEAFGECARKLEETCILEIYRGGSNRAIAEDHFRIHQWASNNWARKPKDYPLHFLIQSHELFAQLMMERGFKHESPLPVVGKEILGFVNLEEVLSYLNPAYEQLEKQFRFRGSEPPTIYLAGKIANLGSTNADIDIRYHLSSWNPILESYLLNSLPKDMRTRVSFILGMDKSGQIIPQVGNLIPLGSEIVYPTIEEEELSYKERLERMKKLKKISLFKPFLQMKSSLPAVTDPNKFRFKEIKDTFPQAFVNDHLLEIGVEPKYAGAFFAVHIKGNKVALFTHSGVERSPYLPRITSQARKLNVKEAIILIELVAYDEEGKPLPYKEVAPAIHAEEPVDDRYWRAFMYDILWFNGRDLTGLEFKERRKILERIKENENFKISEIKRTANP